MKTIARLVLCALLVVGWASLGAAAPEPPGDSGHVLVLDNERILEGDVTRVGEQYRVRRQVGELWITGDKVLTVCATRAEAYAFLRRRANLKDADEHLRLARWCQVQGLKREAIAEAREALALRPNHAETHRLLRDLERVSLPPVAPAVAHASGPDVTPPASAPAVDTESLSVFVTKVQPILMNTCASCHGGTRAGSFKLTRTYGDAITGRRTTHQNLSAVLAQINREHYQLSPLLTKAVSVHGDMAQPALKNRDAVAYRTLDDWVRVTLQNNPQLRDRGAAGEGAVVATTTTLPVVQPAARESAPPAGEVVDPLDPAIFNKQLNVQKKGKVPEGSK